jgi:hypothetical protein
VGEIKVGEEAANPTMSIHLTGVDTDAILAAASHEDNLGNQLRMVRRILFEALGIEDADQMSFTYEFPFLWRNTPRTCEVIYSNVRSLPDTSLTANRDTWKVIIDYPLDEPGHTTRDDQGRLMLYQQNNPAGTRTLVWLPAFFAEAALRDLSRLVVIDHVLTGERLAGYATFLSPQDRSTARTLLENQQSALTQRVKQHIEAAYGIRGSQSRSIDDSHELSDTFKSLYPGLELQPPAASTLGGVMEDLLGQALAFEYPAHPNFGAEIKSLHLRKVHDEVMRAVSETGGRLLVEKNLRSLLKQIAEPLGLGEQGETHFVLGQRWRDHFTRKAAETGVTITVQALRRWIDDPRPMGLPTECENLVILVFAAQTNRSFFRHGAAFEATLTNLPDDLELREQQLPAEGDWAIAGKRAGALFGVSASPILNAANLAKLAEDIQERAKEKIDACRKLVKGLPGHLRDFGEQTAQAPRYQTAEAVLGLLEAIGEAKPAAVIEALAGLTPRTSEAAMGVSFSSAPTVVAALAATQWKLFENIGLLQGEGAAAAQLLLRRVAETLKNDQHVTALESVLRVEQGKAIDLLRPVPGTAPPPPPPLGQPTAPAPVSVIPGKRVVDRGQQEGLSVAEAERLLARLRQQRKETQVARITVSWVIEE